jgi:hypothetical protein
LDGLVVYVVSVDVGDNERECDVVADIDADTVDEWVLDVVIEKDNDGVHADVNVIDDDVV